MKIRGLLRFGVAMPGLYLATLLVSTMLFPGYSPLAQEPSVLGGPTAPVPLVYNAGMVLTALAGMIGGVGLALGLPAIRRDTLLRIFGWTSGLALFGGSVGLGMAGLFPLPDPRHYGFGLTILAAFVPLLGALAMWRAGRAVPAALTLLVAFVAVVATVVLGLPPLIPGVLMLGAAGFLCLIAYGRLNPRRR